MIGKVVLKSIKTGSKDHDNFSACQQFACLRQIQATYFVEDCAKRAHVQNTISHRSYCTVKVSRENLL